ncbi:MAG TPA: hypothetical protein VGL94_24500 [Ktedonobacteraceae bacterium]
MQKIDTYDRIAAIILIFAASLRIFLAALGWPPTNSDEGVMAIMAVNIAYHGAHPVMFYGQNYMGTIEAYLGAGFFHLFGGPSLFALRLGVILLVTLFLICMYLLARLLFSKPLGLVTLLMLSVGSIPMLTRQMIATGGSSQTLFFGSLAFLLAAWLASTYQRHTSLGVKVRRLIAYAVWGLAVGLGIWSDMVVLPFLAMAGLLLLLFCWRELLVWGWLIVLSCMIIGITPLISYDLALKLSPWKVFTGLVHGGNTVAPQTLPGILHNIISTVQVSIPTATGNPFCPVIELRFLGDNAPHSLQCTLIHASWGGGYLLLLACALGVTLRALWYIRFQGKPLNQHHTTDAIMVVDKLIQQAPPHHGRNGIGPLHSGNELPDQKVKEHNRVPTSSPDKSGLASSTLAPECVGTQFTVCPGIASVSSFAHQLLVRYIARLLLLGAAILAICAYTLSSAPVDQPGFHARYLVSLLIATPALIFPLWNVAVQLRPRQTFERIKVYAGRGLLILVWLLLLTGTINAFSEVPAARAADQQRQDLIDNLARIGVTHFYTEYWTCYNLIFASHGQVSCAILESNLQPWDNRIPDYFNTVKADPHAAYVLPLDTAMLPLNYRDLPAVERKVAQAGPGKYRRYEFDGYVVYQPTGTV